MQKIESIEQYKEWINSVKKSSRQIISNLYYLPVDMERYIRQGRLYAERYDTGCVFYIDEQTYYRVCVYGMADPLLFLPAQNKKCVARSVYQDGRVRETHRELGKVLEKNGFFKEATTVQIQGSVTEILQRCQNIEPFARKMERQGYRCVAADKTRFEEIEKIICDSGIVKDYHLLYRTPQEKSNLPEGSYLCILDQQDEICAASLTTIVNGIAQGGAVVVKDKYKLKGLTPILTYYREMWLQKQNVEYTQGWIVTTNVASIRYHTSIGFHLLNKYADEWILDAKEETEYA